MERDKTEKLIFRARNGDADAISETILDCFEHLDVLKEPRYFGTWLVRILLNNCSNIRKQNQKYGPAAGPEMLERNAALRGSSEEEDNRAFLEYLEPLNEEDRRLMILFYVWGFRTREIGELLHWKEATVKARLQRGREKIKKSFFPLVV